MQFFGTAESHFFDRENPAEEIPSQAKDETGRKATLDDLLSLTRQADEAIDDFEIDLEELGKNLRKKIDGITEYLDYCDSRAETIGKRAAELAQKAKAFENKSKFLREYVAQCMLRDAAIRGESTDKLKISGEHYEFALQFSEAVEEVVQPNPNLYLKLTGKFIRRSYAWDKKALKEGLKAGQIGIEAYAKLIKKPYIKIKSKS